MLSGEPPDAGAPAAGSDREIHAYYADPIGTLTRLRARGLPGCPITAGVHDPVVVCDADETQRILNDQHGFHRSGAIFGGAEGSALYQASYGLLAMNGAEHKLHRQRLLAFFRDRSREGGFAQATQRAAAAVTHDWRADDEVDVAQAGRDISFAVLCDAVFGITGAAEQRLLGEQLDSWIEYCLLPGSRLLGKHGQVPAEAERRSRELIAVMMGLITAPAPQSQPSALVSWLFEARDRGVIDDAALIGQLVTMLTAGWETTSAAICWTLALLAHHPAVGRQLHEEVTAGPAAADAATLHRLPVLDGVARESLRLLPPAPGIKRIARHGQEVAGLAVEAGAEVICSPYLLQRDAAGFADAHLFRPERWWNGEMRPGSAYYLPFGVGWRRCVGERLALTELKSALAYLLSRYAFVVPGDCRIDYRVRLSFSPASPVRLRLHERGDWLDAPPASGTWRRLAPLGP